VLQQNLVAAQKQKEDAEEAIEQAARVVVRKARLFYSAFTFADAEKASRSTQATPESVEVNFAPTSIRT